MYIHEIQKQQQKMIAKKIIESDSRHTPIKYNTAFNNFNKYLHQHNITEINQDNINDILLQYLGYLKTESQLTKNTTKQYMILINNFLKNECKYTIDHINLPKAEKPKPKYINSNQYLEIQKYLDEQIQATHTRHKKKILEMDKVIINLLFNTGLRIHEALKITIKELTDAVKDKNNIYQLDIVGKGSKQRTIFIAYDTYNLLMQYITVYAAQNQIYVFESNKAINKPISTMTIERHFQRIAKELDVQLGIDANNKNSYQALLKPHNLRHSFAVVKLDKGISINAMQEFLGHSNITTTQIYTKLNNDSLSDAIAKTL